MLTSYHVHTTFSDGKSTMAEYVQAAVDLGLAELGFSDHFVYPVPNRPVSWSMSLEGVPAYFEALRAARELAGDKFRVRFGLEADYEPRTIGALSDVLAASPLDYAIGSIHYLDDFPVDECADDWEKLTQAERNDMMRLYWNRIVGLAESRLFDLVGHIDLCKKFGHVSTIDLSTEIDTALDAIAASGMAVEINTSGLYKPVKEAYPSPSILAKCRARGIPILITADAHMAADLTRGYGHGIQLAEEAGYTEFATLNSRDA